MSGSNSGCVSCDVYCRVQAGPSPNKEIVTQFIGIGFYTFYSTFLKTCVAQPRKKIYLSLLRKLEAFAQ